MAAEGTDPRPSASRIEEWLGAVRAGSPSAAGQLLEACRGYLLLVANQELEAGLRGKMGPSDLVQDTFLQAQAHLASFRGTSEAEVLAWLKQILRHQLIDVRRRYRRARKRQLAREVPLPGGGGESGRQVGADLVADLKSPGAEAIAREQAEALRQALLPLPDDYQEVIRLRNLERLSFAEIGQHMQRSAEAVRKLWARAIERLQHELERYHEQ